MLAHSYDLSTWVRSRRMVIVKLAWTSSLFYAYLKGEQVWSLTREQVLVVLRGRTGKSDGRRGGALGTFMPTERHTTLINQSSDCLLHLYFPIHWPLLYNKAFLLILSQKERLKNE